MTPKITRFLVAIALLCSFNAKSQSVGIGTENPNANAILELVAPDNNQGLLVPRLSTSERTATTFTNNLSAADNGLMVYDEDENKFFFWINSQWVELATGNLSGLPDQVGQGGKFLATDGSSATWTGIDFSELENIPADLADGDNVDDGDADATNEFQDLTLSGNTISLTNSLIEVDLTPFAGVNTDNQAISLMGTNLSITNGNTLDVSSLVDDADADPTNEDQTVSAGTGISVSQTGEDFRVTNTAPDQTVSLADGGSGNVTIGGTYPSLTIDVPDNLDNDPTNEDQTVSAGTGISVSQTSEDFLVTNTAPDQTVSLADGGSGNVTIGGTYPNLTIDVPDNLDNDPTNEDQTVSAGTGISVSQTGEDFLVSNTAPDQTVSLADGGSGNVTIGGTYPSLTIDVPDNLDNSTTNETNTGMSLTGTTVQVTDANGTVGVDIGATFATDTELSAITSSQWTTNATSINYTTGGVNIGSTALPSAQLQVLTTTENNTIDVNNNFSGVGSKTGINVNLNNEGSANKTGINNQIFATVSSSGSLTGILNEFTPANGPVVGISNTINSNGTGLRFGSSNTVNGAAGNSSDIYGFRSQLTHEGSGNTYAFFSQDFGSSSGTEYGVFIFGEDHNYFSGNVGIGESAPSAVLDVVGDTELNGQLTVTNDIEIPAANDYTYATAKTKVASFHPTEFQVLNVAAAEEVLLTPLSVNLYVFFSGGTGGQAFATAPVKLPDDAVVTQLDAWVVDNNASEFVRVSLARNEVGLSTFNQTMAQVETDAITQSTAVNQLTDNTIFNGTVDNSTYAYYLRFTSSNSNDSELQLHGVKITYTIRQAD